MCLPAAPETGDAIDGSSAVTSTTSIVVTDPVIDSRGRMCCVSLLAYRLGPLGAVVSVSLYISIICYFAHDVYQNTNSLY